MNRNRHLSEKTYGARHVQPSNPKWAATKPKSKVHVNKKEGK